MCVCVCFYLQVMERVEGWVKDLNDNLDLVPYRGEWSKYEIEEKKDETGKVTKEARTAKLVFTFDNKESPPLGVACDTKSKGFFALCDGFKKENDKFKGKKTAKEVLTPYSISGSLPLVREMKDEGFT